MWHFSISTNVYTRQICREQVRLVASGGRGGGKGGMPASSYDVSLRWDDCVLTLCGDGCTAL